MHEDIAGVVLSSFLKSGYLRYIILPILILNFTIIYSYTLSGIPSAFMDVGLGARYMSLGGVDVPLSNDATAIISNPANLMLSTAKYNFSADYADIFTLYNYTFFGATTTVDDGLKMGVGIIYSGDDAMSETTIIISTGLTGDYLHEFFNFKADKLALGFNLKLLYASLGNNPNGALYDDQNLNHQVKGESVGGALDFGVNYIAREKNNLALMWKNPISYQSWNSKNEVGTAKGKYVENIPAQLFFGYARTENKVVIALELEKSIHKDTDSHIAVGVEYKLFPDIMDLRAGYANELLTGQNKKYTFGTGFMVPVMRNSIKVDVAYQIQTNWENHNTLNISIGYGF